MLAYIVQRILLIIPMLIAISILSFAVIQLPPGDFLTSYVAQLRQEGDEVDEAELESLRQRYGLGQPAYVQYFKWIYGVLVKGDWGQSFEWQKPVSELIWERLGLTMALSMGALLVGWFIAIPVGVYSATHQYSWLDYLMTTFSFVGLGTPGFLLALIILFMAQSLLGVNVGGLFSDEYVLEPWSWPKIVDMLKHIWVPMLIVAVNGTAGNIRITRANLLDELNKPYVETARAKGVKESSLIWKYPVRVALNPFFSTVGWSLASLVSGTTLVAMVLSLQTTGPLLLRSLTSQDMYLAGSFLFLLSTLTVIGTLLSDVLLAIVDPRIRLQ
ncbi:MAG: ABC transporter permease [Caldilineaceae bacterium SB0670_bin_27]|uniref:ABC transporter permease n=1 Tax=Caldilineaceae bacterium SB0664_bin_27 TaxID=2605260 RepID=A0A6B0Z045_9CHLR|nr:ABC transporter permease [Caldilineaceae bacterium]MDE0336518.1 ABC transporter permease [Caldilineaceae bacterium]MXY95825.1 ABC transporter permease [Caldilineaceae bacterium SB0664_bin_27]MYJ77670.1 ABC transporter permease [Caldilineaceae bacterium SB0670_bin_27]